MTVYEGDNLSIELNVKGERKPVVKWLIKREVKDGMDRIKISEQGTRQMLSIKDCRRGDTGQATLEATNQTGKLKHEVYITVQGMTEMFVHGILHHYTDIKNEILSGK